MNASLKIDVQMKQRKIIMIEFLRRLTDFDRLQSLNTILSTIVIDLVLSKAFEIIYPLNQRWQL